MNEKEVISASVIRRLVEERIHQDKRWGGREHDGIHSFDDWADIIAHYFDLAFVGALDSNYVIETPTPQQMIAICKMAALCIVCMEIYGCPKREDV